MAPGSTGEDMIPLLLWLCWSGAMGLAGLFIFVFHFVENASLVMVGGVGSILAIASYFIGKQHRVEDEYDEEDLEPGQRYCVLWKNSSSFNCQAVLRERGGRLLPFVLPKKLFDDLSVDQEFEVEQFSPYHHDEDIPEDSVVPKTYFVLSPSGAPSRVG